MDNDKSKDTVISRGLRAEGLYGHHQNSGRVTFDPRDLSHHNLRLNHFGSDFPSFGCRSRNSKNLDGTEGSMCGDETDSSDQNPYFSSSTALEEHLRPRDLISLSQISSTYSTDKSTLDEVNTGTSETTDNHKAIEIRAIERGFDTTSCTTDNLTTGLSTSDSTGENTAGVLSSYPSLLAQNNDALSSYDHETAFVSGAAQSELQTTTTVARGLELSEHLPTCGRFNEEPTQNLPFGDKLEFKLKGHFVVAKKPYKTFGDERSGHFHPTELNSLTSSANNSSERVTIPCSSKAEFHWSESPRRESKIGLFIAGGSETRLSSSRGSKHGVQLGADRESVRAALNLCFSKRVLDFAKEKDNANTDSNSVSIVVATNALTEYTTVADVSAKEPSWNPLLKASPESSATAGISNSAQFPSSNSEPTRDPSLQISPESNLTTENSIQSLITNSESARNPTHEPSQESIEQKSGQVTNNSIASSVSSTISPSLSYTGSAQPSSEIPAASPASEQKARGIRRRPTPAPIHTPFFKGPEDEEAIFAALGQDCTGLVSHKHDASLKSPHCDFDKRTPTTAYSHSQNFETSQIYIPQSYSYTEHYNKIGVLESRKPEQETSNQIYSNNHPAELAASEAKFDVVYSNRNVKKSVRFTERTSIHDRSKQQAVDNCEVSSAVVEATSAYAENKSLAHLFPGNAGAPDLVAIETPYCHESYYCGGPVSVLPPIVERAESDVTSAQPIAKSRKADSAFAMLSGRSEPQKFPFRGRRLAVEQSFVVRKKSHECCPSGTVTSSDTQQKQQQSEKDSDTFKVRKIASYHLPRFSLHQTPQSSSPLSSHLSFEQESDQANNIMASKQNNKSPRNSAVRKLGVSQEHMKLAQDKRNSATSETQIERKNAAATTVCEDWTEPEPVHETPPPCSLTPSSASSLSQVVYNVSMCEDNIRVDFGGDKDTGNVVGDNSQISFPSSPCFQSAKCSPSIAGSRLCPSLVLLGEHSGSTQSINSSGSGSVNSPRQLSGSEDDFFADDMGQGFHLWSEQKKPGRAITTAIPSSSSAGVRVSSSSLQQCNDASSQGARTTREPGTDNKNNDGHVLPTRRTVSDGYLCQKVRHLFLEDDQHHNPYHGGESSSGRAGVNASWSTLRPIARSPSSTFALSPTRRHSLAVTLEDKRDRVRRNSVTVLIPKGSRSSPTTRHQSSLERGSSSHSTTSVPRRRWSSRTALEKTLPASVHDWGTVTDIAARLELLTWTQLLSTYSETELQGATVRRSEIVVTIPVCEVTKDGSSISVTSVDAIEQTLYHFHPALQILLSGTPAASKDDATLQPFLPPVPSQQSSSDVSTTAASTVSVSGLGFGLSSASGGSGVSGDDCALNRRHACPSLVIPGEDGSLSGDRIPPRSQLSNLGGKQGDDSRRVSINTCIRTMREGSSNYDSQLQGCENMGSYADEETLKVVLAKSDAISCIINAMKLFLEKEELQRQACASLLKMASTSEAYCRYISQNDGVTVITNTMRRYENNLEVTKLALCILGYLSTTEELTVELLSYGCHSDVLAAMSRHSDNRTIVNQSCFILGNLVTSVETAQQLMMVGGVHTVISMLKHYHDDTDILENGCRALGSFALYDETCLDVAQAGATETVVEAMTSPFSDDNVKDCCCWALACLTSIAHTCKELVSLNGLPVLLDTLEEFPLQESLQDYGVRTLCNVGALECTVQHVASPRVIRLLTGLHDNFPDNVELLEYMTLALSQIAAVEQVQEYLLTGGALKTVMNVMRSLEENPAIQENGCRILGNLAVNESLRKSVEQQGSSQAVIAAMLNIDMSADIQWYGCMALMNLTADLMDNKMRVKNNGAVPTLLSTLRNFPGNDEVVLSALKTLGNLVDLEEACRQLLDDRGLSTIVHMAKDVTAGDEIRSFAGLVLSALTALPDLAVDDLLLAVETLVTIQAAIPTDADLALSMCQGLHNLIKSKVGLETLSQAGWMAVIENTMNHFQAHCEIHLTAIRIVATVATECRRGEEWTSSALSADTVTTVLHSMRLFPHDKEVQVVACAALSCVCEAFGHLRTAIMKVGGISDVISAMTTFPTDDRLHAVGLIALSYLLPVDITTDRDLAVAAVNIILKSMAQFVENEHIQISAFRALERCSIEGMEEVFSILTSVYNGIRRHGTKDKVVRAAGKVFKRFGVEEAEGITEQMLTSPSTPFGEIIEQFLKK